MIRIQKLFILFVILTLTFSLAGCASTKSSKETNADKTTAPTAKPAANTDKTIKIGFPAPLSGPNADTGSDMEKGITLAIEDLNAAGGIDGHKFELVKGDVEGGEPSTVTTVVKRLINKDKVDAMVTGFVNPSLVELNLMQDNKIPYVFYGFAMTMDKLVPKDPAKYSYIHDAIPSYKQYQTAFPNLVEQWIKDGKFNPINKKIAIIKSQSAYALYTGEGMQETFKKLGWDVVVDETIPFERFTEFSPILNKIRKEKPSVIMYTDNESANAATFLNGFLEDPTPSLVFLQATPSYAEFQKIMDGKQKGVIWNYAAALLGDKAQAFNKKYEAKWGEAPNPYGAFVYDAMMLTADAMKKSGDPFNKEAVNNVLNSADYSYTGNIGIYRFDPKTHLAISGNNEIPFVSYQEWDGHGAIAPENIAQAQFQLPPWYDAALKKYGK